MKSTTSIALITLIAFHSNITNADEFKLVKTSQGSLFQKHSHTVTETQTDRAVYLIMGTDLPIARYRGGIDGYDSTLPKGATKLDMHSQAVIAYQSYLQQRQQALQQTIETVLGRDAPLVASLQTALNGLALALTPEEAKTIAQLPEVQSISRTWQPVNPPRHPMQQDDVDIPTALMPLKSASSFVPPHTFSTLQGLKGAFSWINAPTLWHGAFGQQPSLGEGMVVGVIDSHFVLDTPAFAETGSDGYTVKNPRHKYYGVCDPNASIYDPKVPCNAKVIGRWMYEAQDTDHPDRLPHASSVAAIAAGNVVYNAPLTLNSGRQILRNIAGVAPHANIISYQVCSYELNCPSVAVILAIDQAIQDDVDVINYSIGLANSSNNIHVSLWDDPLNQAFLSAASAGILVVHAANNGGPAPKTRSRDALPWTIDVGVTHQPVVYRNFLVDLKGDDPNNPPPQGIYTPMVTDKIESARILSGPRLGNPYCKDKFDVDVKGAIVVCLSDPDPASTLRTQVETYWNSVIKQGGAGILNPFPKTLDGVPTGPGLLDSYHSQTREQFMRISYQDGQRLLKWLSTGHTHTGQMTGTQVIYDPASADTMVAVSARGPLSFPYSLLAPEITAPGGGILSISNRQEKYELVTGTSSAAPLVAGGATLLKANHPNWTPMEIKSAMMTTAHTNIVKMDGMTPATPFDMGAGRLDLARATRAGLVLDETTEHFIQANPERGGDPSTLNLASLPQYTCVIRCTWHRTVTNRQNFTTSWLYLDDLPGVSVEPAGFSLAPGESETLTITADVSETPVGQWRSGIITLQSLLPGVPNAHFTMVARSASNNLDRTLPITVHATENQGTQKLSGLKVNQESDISTHLLGLTRSQTFKDTMKLMDKYGEHYGEKVYYFQIPNGTQRIVLEVSKIKKNGLGRHGSFGLYIGTSENMSNSSVYYGTLMSSKGYEYFDVPVPKGVEKIWVLVNTESVDSYIKTLEYRLDVAFLRSDKHNFSVSIPNNIPAGEDLNASMTYQLPEDAKAGEYFYGMLHLSDVQDNDLGSAVLKVIRD